MVDSFCVVDRLTDARLADLTNEHIDVQWKAALYMYGSVLLSDHF